MNWAAKWKVRQTRYTLNLMCPWFAIQIATGWTPETSRNCWRGVLLRWGAQSGQVITSDGACPMYRYVDDSLVQRRVLQETPYLLVAERTNVLMHNFILQMIRANEALMQFNVQMEQFNA